MTYDPQRMLDEIPEEAYRVTMLEHLRGILEGAIDGVPLPVSELHHATVFVQVNGRVALLLRDVIDAEVARCTPE